MKKLELTFLVIVLTVLSSGAKAQYAEVTPVFPAVEPAAVPVEEAVADPGFSLTGYVDAYFQGNLIKARTPIIPWFFPPALRTLPIPLASAMSICWRVKNGAK